ncbi:MAG TPA: HutD family protein [Kofleriaceae bacterium]|nr:HutD family protein [Kofleriaceae bacterium]
MRIVTPAEYWPQPWKNGGGITHEIVRWPDSRGPGRAPDPGAAYDIRISLADDNVAAPFSRFPGFRRWSFLAGAAPIVLDVAGRPHELTRLGDHLEVGGDVPITCALPAGPTRLLNILVRDGVAAVVGHGPCPQPVRFVFALEAMPWLPQGCSAVFEPPELAILERHAIWLV